MRLPQFMSTLWPVKTSWFHARRAYHARNGFVAIREYKLEKAVPRLLDSQHPGTAAPVFPKSPEFVRSEIAVAYYSNNNHTERANVLGRNFSELTAISATVFGFFH